VTAVFKDGTDIYFVRQQVSQRRCEAGGKLGEGAEVSMVPVLYAYFSKGERPAS
jgi:cobalt-zinc-cadmium resistance protein CzcA